VSEYILDASALIAMLRSEPGADRVSKTISDARMSVINYSEVVSYFVHAGMDARDVDAMLDPLPIEWIPVDKELANLAGRLRKSTASAGLSLGDRFCIALAKRDGLAAWTADKGWKTIESDVGVEVVIIR
jgi:PIN domain nuclease of toxin-antitoxin system